MNVLVTGATGFVGGWLTKALIEKSGEQNFNVKILARSTSGTYPFDLKRVTVTKGDVTDLESLKRALTDVDLVFHLAGVVSYSLVDRKKMEAVNVGGTANVLAAMKSTGSKKLIFMSSITSVGASFDGKSILNENSEYNLHRLNLCYYETKRAAEELVLKAARAGVVHAVSLNPSNIYGAGDAQKGSRSTQIKVAKGAFPFYTTGGVSIVHVNDVVAALIAAVTKGRSGERYILSGENVRLIEMFKMIADVAGVSPPKRQLPNIVVRAMAHVCMHIEQLGRRAPLASETLRASLLFHWFDSSKAQRDLDFRFTPAREAIADSVNWMKANGVI
jgi:dihydroflavonol-4-reductase